MVLFVSLYLFAGYKMVTFSKDAMPEIEIFGNNLIKTDYISDFISSSIAGKNFFLISPRYITNDLNKTIGLIQDLVIRKYIIPEYKISVSLKEKNLWAKLITSDGESDRHYSFVAQDGSVVSPDYLNIDLISPELVNVYLIGTGLIEKEKLCLVKDVVDFVVKNIGLTVHKIVLLNKSELEIYCDNELRIKAGVIDETLNERMKTLLKSINVIKDRSFMIEYIDLTLESGVVIKKSKETMTKSIFSLIKRDNN